MNILGIKIHDLNKSQFQHLAEQYLLSGNFHQIITVNPEMLVAANQNKKFKLLLKNNELNLADGFGIILAAWLLFQSPPHRLPGSDILKDIFKLAEKHKCKITILGGRKNAAHLAKDKILQVYPHITTQSLDDIINYENEDENWQQPSDLISRINQFSPQILIVALGQVKQEFWIKDHQSLLPSVALAVGVGGAIDYFSDIIPRAPQIWRKMGLEWLFRLIIEPHRVKRIYRAIFVFLSLVFKYHVLGQKTQ